MLITPLEIREKARKWLHPFLASIVADVSFFPKEIRFAKVKPTWTRDHFQELHESLRNLRQRSKEVTGSGYTVVWQEVANRSVGKNEFPEKISIDSEADFRGLLSKKDQKTIERFKRDANNILANFPILLEWVENHPQKVCRYAEAWPSLLKVCKYFVTSHQPNRHYIRELPIEVHTKFIEQHKGILTELFNLLLPGSLIATAYTGTKDHHFERRYGLKYDETQIRYRSLMPKPGVASDVSLRHSDFARQPLPGTRVIITENKMNFLTLPQLEGTSAILGGGFNLHLLRYAHWLKDKHIYYWGDIDAHGFWMLSQFREYFPHVTSLMMDRETFDAFQYDGQGSPIQEVRVDYLTEEERALFKHVKGHNLRLEQEKIPYYWVIKQLQLLLTH
ncbi:MAG: Wadjet anti-phage system protein JetD domain-containing protein [Bacteroidota bacterium]